MFDTKPLRHLGPKTAYERNAAADPDSVALYEAGASHAGPMEFWMTNGGGQQEYRLTNPNFSVLKSPDCRSRVRKNVNCQWGVRLGANARGEFANHLQNPQHMPPALLRSSPTAVWGCLRARGQCGFPASMHTDAFLGCCAMGYRSWEVAGASVMPASTF